MALAWTAEKRVSEPKETISADAAVARNVGGDVDLVFPVQPLRRGGEALEAPCQPEDGIDVQVAFVGKDHPAKGLPYPRVVILKGERGGSRHSVGCVMQG